MYLSAVNYNAGYTDIFVLNAAQGQLVNVTSSNCPNSTYPNGVDVIGIGDIACMSVAPYFGNDARIYQLTSRTMHGLASNKLGESLSLLACTTCTSSPSGRHLPCPSRPHLKVLQQPVRSCLIRYAGYFSNFRVMCSALFRWYSLLEYALFVVMAHAPILRSALSDKMINNT
jgi:hypothetical protein